MRTTNTPSEDGPFRVFIGLVPQGYLTREALGATIRDGLEFCRLLPKLDGKIVIRPDIVGADDLTPHAYTHPAMIREILHLTLRGIILAQSNGVLSTQTSLLQAHGGLPEFKSRGYYQFETMFEGASVQTIEESPQVRYLLAKDGLLSLAERQRRLDDDYRRRFWPEIVTSRHFLDAGCLIYCPKIRTSLYSDGFSGAIRLGGIGNLVGSQVSEGVLHHNDRRMVDMLEVANPNIIISDGVVIPYGGNELTARGQELGVVLVADNAVAHDIIAARILNLDPKNIRHIQIAQARGWGPTDEKKILIGGGGLEAIDLLKRKTTLWPGFRTDLAGFLEKFSVDNEGAALPFEVLGSTKGEATDVAGVFLNWLHLNYDFPAKRLRMARWPRISVVLGATLQTPKHRRVFVIGDDAIGAFRKQINTVKTRIVRGSREFLVAQLRDGRHYLVWLQRGSPPTEKDLSILFLIGSALRMRTGLLRISLFHRRMKQADPDQNASRPAVKTTEMRRNQWWQQL